MYPQAPGFFHCSTVSGARSWNINPLFPDPSLQGNLRNLMEIMWKNHNGVSIIQKKGGNSHTSNVVATSQDSLSPSQQPWLQSIYRSLWVPRSRWHDWRQRSPGSVACNCQGANLHKLVSFQWGLLWDLDGSWWLGSTVCVFLQEYEAKGYWEQKHFQNVSF